jgi:hemoglobin-like flavoprotein
MEPLEAAQMDIQESVHRVLQSKETFGSLFYEVFFTRCPEARAYFAGLNMEYQAALLTMALKMLEAYHTHGYPAMAAYLKYLGHKHHMRAVLPELYSQWGDALLAALEQFHGDAWSDAVARQWRAAFEKARDVMLLGHQEPLHV